MRTAAVLAAVAMLALAFPGSAQQPGQPFKQCGKVQLIFMNPDYVQDHAASWDHRLYEANNPLLAGILVHHVAGTDPTIPNAGGLAMLDLNNPGDEPNDGIMFTADEYFHSGSAAQPTHSFVHTGHLAVPSSDAFHALAAAGLFHRRKVFVTLESVALFNDREFSLSNYDEQGAPPAEVVAETDVYYDPYTLPAFGRAAHVHQDRIDFRSADMFQQFAGTTLQPGQSLFEGPVFDGQDAFYLFVQLTEADWYPRWNVREAAVDPNRKLVAFAGVVPLVDHVIHVESEYAAADIAVHVVALY